MSSRLLAPVLVGALGSLTALAACGNAPSALDHSPNEAAHGAHHASASGSRLPARKRATTRGRPSAAKTASDDDKGSSGPLGGIDIQGMLAKVRDSIQKPGPFEAPEQSANYDAAKPAWGVMKVGGAVVERESFSFTGSSGTELRTLIGRFNDLAEEDPLTTGVLLRVEPLEISLPDAVELRAAMHALRTAGKKLACHAENASQGTYLVMAACDQIGLAPLGDVSITGPSAMPIHIKPLLDKLGVTADFLHVGAYKGAAEPLTRDEPSKEMTETLGAILDGRYQTMVDMIAADRKLDAATVKADIDTALFPSDQALTAKLVDAVQSFEDFRDHAVGDGAWKKLELDADKKDALAEMMKLARFFGAMPNERPTSPHVVVFYAVGDIVDGDGKGLLGARQEIAAHTVVAALRALTNDDNVKAVVLRIDSGGGSAQASELIWTAVTALRAKKPVIVSMSDVAASGGYYIASGATKIYALDDTLTGSIGVVGGKIAPGGALAKLGVATFPMGRGKRATMMSSLSPWTDEEKATIQASMEAVYKVFVGRVASGRGKTPEQIQPIAQGRVWTGEKAKELGLVDEIGGFDAAVAEAQQLAKVDAATDLEIYPSAPTLRDVLAGFGAVHVPFGLGASASTGELGLAADMLGAVGAIDPQLADAAERMVRLAMSFRTTTIQTVAALPVMR